MELTIERAALARTLAAAGKAVEKRNTIPILGNILLVAEADRLSVRATDLDIEINAHVTCDIAKPGRVAVDAKRLTDIARKMAGTTVSMVLDGANLTVKSGRSRFVLPTLPADDFPSLPDADYTAMFDVDLAGLVAPTKFAMSTEETRYYLNGVYLHTTDEHLVAVATDGHRLARNRMAPVGAFTPAILPRELVELLPTGVVNVSMSPSKVRVATADSVIVSKLIDGTYPDYDRVIPRGNDKELIVGREAMRDAAGRVATVSADRGSAVKVTLAEGTVSLSVTSDVGSSYEDVPAEYSSEEMSAGFNSKYLAEILGALSGENVTVLFADAGSPALFKGEGDLLTVLMPMRVA